MSRAVFLVLSAAVVVLTFARLDAARAEGVAGKANVLGVVRTSDRQGVRDVDVVLLGKDGTELARATTAPDGGYQLPCIEYGTYQLALEPKDSGLGGETVVVPIREKGLVVVWTMAPDKPALASSTPGGGPCRAGVADAGAVPTHSDSVTSSNLTAIGATTGTIAVGATLGGLAASGAFDSGSDSGAGDALSPAQ